MTSQRSDCTQVQFGEPTSLLGLLTGDWGERLLIETWVALRALSWKRILSQK